MKTVLNPHLVNKAVDIYATTPNVQHNFVADELGISYKSLQTHLENLNLPDQT